MTNTVSGSIARRARDLWVREAAKLSRDEAYRLQLAHKNAAAQLALDNFNPCISDVALAGLVADRLMTMGPPGCHFSILHDVRPAAERRWRKQLAIKPTDLTQKEWEKIVEDHLFRSGPCRLTLHWHYKNIAGIKYYNDDFTRRWIIDALCFGYAVFRASRSRSWGCGPGTLTEIRQRRTKRP